MSGWDRMLKAREENGSLFVRLKDGDSIEGIFRGDPYCFFQKFKDPNEYQDWADGRSFKFKINFITRDNGTPIAKIFQGGATLRDMLIDAKEEYGLDVIYKIKRTGSGKDDTRYSILFKTKLTSDQLELINKVELLSLEKKERIGSYHQDDYPLNDAQEPSFP